MQNRSVIKHTSPFSLKTNIYIDSEQREPTLEPQIPHYAVENFVFTANGYQSTVALQKRKILTEFNGVKSGGLPQGAELADCMLHT